MHQSIILIGYLGRDPEMRYTPSGQPVTSFSVATSRRYKDTSDQPISETAWFRVTAWGNLAEICNQYLHKGSRVFVEGRMSVDVKTGGPRIWQDRDGAARASFEVVAGVVRFLSGKEEESEHKIADAEDGNDLPF